MEVTLASPMPITFVGPLPAPFGLTVAELTEELREAIAALENNNEENLSLQLRIGERLWRVKGVVVKHGEFGPWCAKEVQRSPSWCALRMRLYKTKDDIEPALKWADEIDHKWKNALSAERILKLVGEWKQSFSGRAGAPSRKRSGKTTVADLRRQLEENEKEFAGLRDPLTDDAIAGVKMLLEIGDENSQAEIASVARRYHWRVGDLTAHICSAMQK